MSSTSNFGLLGLPEACMSIVIYALLEDGGNPGDVARLSMASKELQSTISRDVIWEKLCQRQGWWRGGAAKATLKRGSLAALKPPTAQDNKIAQQSPGVQQLDPFFLYYCERMSVRYMIRSLLKRLSPFLARGPSGVLPTLLGFRQSLSLQAGFNPGASVAALQRFEDRTGFQLPWQLWELWRYHNGQERGSDFANGGRLLSLTEVYADWKSARQITSDAMRESSQAGSSPSLQDVGVCPPAASDQFPETGEGGGTAAAVVRLDYFTEGKGERWGEGHREGEGDAGRTLPLTADFSGNRRYVFDGSGRIYLETGFNRLLVAQDLADFLRGILRCENVRCKP